VNGEELSPQAKEEMNKEGEAVKLADSVTEFLPFPSSFKGT